MPVDNVVCFLKSKVDHSGYVAELKSINDFKFKSMHPTFLSYEAFWLMKNTWGSSKKIRDQISAVKSFIWSVQWVKETFVPQYESKTFFGLTVHPRFSNLSD